jgi:two-component sensor histidine kinase
VTGLTGSAIDVSDECHQAQSLAALIMEVSHRSRNMLAIVQSIAVQTAQSESSIDVYRNRFVGRLQSLSRTQDIITASDWQGADADELVRAQLGGMADFVRLSIAGANVSFAPSSALHFGLAVHELATNAREGTISAHDRQIAIELVQTGETEHPLRFRWRERVDGREPSFGAFAKSILERAAPRAVDGHAELDVSDQVMLYQLHIGEGGLHGRH